MRYIYVLLVSMFFCNNVFCKSETDSLLYELHKVIKESSNYDAFKIEAIEHFKKKFRATSDSDLVNQFRLCERLYKEYSLFNFDSAFVYSKKMQIISDRLNDQSLIASTKINLGFILLSAGMFKEAIEVLNTVNTKAIPDSSKANYYSLLARYYFDLSDYTYNTYYSSDYRVRASKYLDSSLAIYPKSSFSYQYYLGLKNFKNGNTDSAFSNFQNILKKMPDISFHEYALVTSTLSGLLYSYRKDQKDEARNLLIEAAIADIKSSTKETTALFHLASLLFEQGDIKNASIYIEKANNDAQFYGSRQRKVDIGSILPIIEGQVINSIEVQKKNLLHYAIIITLLFLTVILLIIIIYRQLSKLRITRDAVIKAHEKEQETNQLLNEANRIKDHYNSQLKASNSQLLESNKIKEEYIGYFFHADYKLLEKFEKLKSLLERKLVERKFDEIRYLLQNINVKKEQDELLKSFDKIFIKLFPNFVNEFNSLFAEENQILLKEDGVLNTELRIFALIRIGISENEKIAQILDYSVNTIYTYKTKIRNKSLVPKDEFDQKLHKATTLNISD